MPPSRQLAVVAAFALGGLASCSPQDQSQVVAVAPGAVDTLNGGAVVVTTRHLMPDVTLDFDRPSTSQVRPDVVLQLGAGDLRVPLTLTKWNRDALDAVVPPGVPMGIYDVWLTDPRGWQTLLSSALEVMDCLTRDCTLPDGGPLDAGVQPCERLTYEDRDRDGFGTGDAGALCGPGRADVAGDCNDGDALTHPGAPEVCNALDDDCDGVVDNGVCPRDGGAWIRRTDTGGNGNDWESAWALAPGQVWLVGGPFVYVRRNGNSFTDVSDSCPANLNAVWADENGGTAYALGGNDNEGRFARHLVSRDRCEAALQQRDPAAGAVGVLAPDGGLDVYVALRDTRVVRWRPLDSIAEIQAERLPNTQLNDFHGAGADALFAVGSQTSPDGGTVMKVFRFELAGRRWVDQRVDMAGALPPGALRGVWVLGPRQVVAVGDDGAAAVLDGLSWRTASTLDGGSLTSVRAFSLGRFLTTDDEGHVRRFDGQKWRVLFDNAGAAPLRDVTAPTEDDVWAVGHDGWVVHWPQ